MALGGFVGAFSKSDAQLQKDEEARMKKEAAEKKASIEKNKKDKKMLQKGLGKTLGGGVADVFSFGSKGKGGIMGSLGLGPKKYTMPAGFGNIMSMKRPTVPLAEIVPMSSVMKINRPPVNSYVTGKY
jgi:hypothetical protein